MGIKFEVGDRITAKKRHPCGSTVWVVVRTGADYKIKCEGCGRTVFLSKDDLEKMTKSVERREN